MGFGFFPSSILDQPDGDRTIGGAPGKRSRTQSLGSRDASAREVEGLGVGATSPEYVDLVEHASALRGIANRASHLADQARQGRPAAEVADSFANLAAQAAPHLVGIAAQLEQDARASRTNTDAARSFDPFVAGPARKAQDKTADESAAKAGQLDHATAALDELSRAGYELARASDGDAPRATIGHALADLRDLGAQIGWHHPASLEDADARVIARTACDDDSRDDRPDHCDMSSTAREELRRTVHLHLVALARRFGAECDRHAQTLEAAIARDQKLAELIAGVIVEILLLAVTGGVGNAFIGSAAATGSEVAATATVAAGTEVAATAVVDGAAVAAKATSSVIRGYGEKVAGALAKTALGKTSQTLAPDRSVDDPVDPRRKTIGYVGRLAASVDNATDDLVDHLRALDDQSLRMLDGVIVGITSAKIREHLDPIVRAYRAEIEPIGEISTAPGMWSRRDTVKRAARIQGAGGSMLALVAVTTDAVPAIRAGVRTVAAGAAHVVATHNLGDPGLVADVPDRDFSVEGLSSWAAEPYDEVEFIRWIDDPAMAAIADKVAIDLPAERVRDLPYLGYLGVREAHGAP